MYYETSNNNYFTSNFIKNVNLILASKYIFDQKIYYLLTVNSLSVENSDVEDFFLLQLHNCSVRIIRHNTIS